MVETIALSIIASLGVTSVVASNVLFLGITGAIYVGASVGLSTLASLFIPKPKAPRPEDVQNSLKQPLSPRYRHYGRVKSSGSWVFADSKEGFFYKLLAVGQGPIDGIEEYWVDDKQVTLDSNGFVLTEDFVVSGSPKVRFETRLGQTSETYYSSLSSAFSEWTSDHKGNGVTSILATQIPLDPKGFSNVFPNSYNTSYRLVFRGVLVESPVNFALGWSDNATSIIRDYLYHPDGLRLNKQILMTPLAQAGWQKAFADCNVPFDLKAGGTEPRYRLWGSYSLEERPADVLNRMLIACDGRLKITPDGGLTLDIGNIPQNPVVIDDSMILNFSDVGRGRDILTTANVIRSSFINSQADYQSSDADPWVDEEDVGIRGEIVQEQDYVMAPSHAQCRRLMKLAAYRANPNWVGNFTCNLKALAAFNERFVRIKHTMFGINEIFEVQDFGFDIGENGILQSVTVQVSSLPQAAYDWDAGGEEGIAPISEKSDGTSVIPLPGNFNVIIDRKTVNGAQYPFAILSFDLAPLGLATEAQGRKVGDVNWQSIAVAEGATSAESFLLEDGAQYEFQVRYRSISVGEWSPSIVVTAVADPIAPDPINSLVVTGGTSKVDTSWQSPNSSNFAATNIYRNTTNNLGTATLIRTEYGAANFPFTYTNQPLAAGTYYYWFRSRNYSGVQGTAVASGAIVVT